MDDEKNTVKPTLTFDDETFNALNEAIEQIGCSKAYLIKSAIEDWLEENGYLIRDNW